MVEKLRLWVGNLPKSRDLTVINRKLLENTDHAVTIKILQSNLHRISIISSLIIFFIEILVFPYYECY